MTDRLALVVVIASAVDVRRLMYQSLICSGEEARLGDHPCRFAAPLDAEDVERLADALIDGVRRDQQAGGDFLGRQMLENQPETFQLSRGQAGDSPSDAPCPAAIMSA